ncbi:hypothetical protein BC939DRAFT_465193 [Gamsiella multidivaricata]|uniref:uncharacterized protein n=1 Tax=Gamsiella multidivaricata TaxID=101098 RepID=UPI00221FD461|nr:uncharacterized protein BC939DRAFT_465193 [Gamsiella multidivaricata]KAG0371008.1 hypothetical protein BGZ54_001773 [Gamsiella multidivaricata]KAI7817662.1 hypothetical protein BC939DRAFT_465193 [Gamsiella multidivaricata]
MGYTFDIELDTEQPFIVELDMAEHKAQTISGVIALKLGRADSFRIATIAIHGHIGAMLNVDTPEHAIVREPLVSSSVDLVAANDTDGRGIIHIDAGEQYIPFRIDIPRAYELPPTLINKLDTPYIDWKYEIHATLRRSYFFSSTRVVKHDLILRRPIAPTSESTLTASMDRSGQYKSKLTAPGRLVLGQDRLLAKVELETRNKEFMIKEVDCSIVQIEEVDYVTRLEHPSVENANVPGAHCTVNSSRLVSALVVVPNDDSDMDFGRFNPVEFDLRVDNDQLIPTEHGLGWLNISHVLRYTVHFMDVNQPALITELPLFVANEVISKACSAKMRPQPSSARLVDSLKVEGTEDHHLQHDRESTPESD